MTKDAIDTTERRTGTSRLIGNMLAERNQLLNLLLRVSGMSRGDTPELDHDLLDEFCQVMVDYVAAGHFGLFERIVEGTERRRGVADLAVKLYPEIERTTELVLAFNEKYSADRDDVNMKRLHEELSELGEELTGRVEHEDQLIKMLSRKH